MPASFHWIKWLLFGCLLAVVFAGEKVQMKYNRECKGELYIPFRPCVRYCRVGWMLFLPKYKEQEVEDGTPCKRLLVLRGVCLNGKCVKPKGKVTRPPRINFTEITMTAEATSTTPAPLILD